ncbi:IS3 family transposase [Limnohabitans sp.]|uniref:IS3 family transposase n=1 Tax=Limnohabitans sp. TaxID=1907725 RepID=UPI00333E92CE
MVSDHQLSRSKACKLVGLSRSALYKPKTDWAAKDAPVVDALNAIVAVRARWGFWKFFTRMRKDGLPWNHKRVYRVYCDMRLNMKRRTKKRFITRERQPPCPSCATFSGATPSRMQINRANKKAPHQESPLIHTRAKTN